MWHPRWLIAMLVALALSAGSAFAAEVNDLNITDASNTARFPENMAPSAVNDGARALEGIIARWDKDTNGSKVTTGSANAYVFAANQTLSAYFDGMDITFDANFTNTGAATINVDAIGAKSIVKNFNEALGAGDITAGQKVRIIYDGTNFQMMSPVDNALRVGDSNGGDVALTILNEAASGSTDETVSLVFQHVASTGPGGKIVSGRTGDYGSAGAEDSFMAFQVTQSGTDVERMRLGGPDGAGLLYVGVAGTNAKMTQGITIDQGGTDDEILAFKSSDVAHGLTSTAETDTYFFGKKRNAAEGGTTLLSIAEDAAVGNVFSFQAYGGTANTGKTTAVASARGLIAMYSSEHNGSGAQANITANGNVFTVAARVGGQDLIRFLIDEDGDMLTVVAGGTFDAHDDAMLVRAFDLQRSDEFIRSEWDKFARNNTDTLTEAGILGRITPEEKADGYEPLWNITQHVRLLNGATWQGYVRDMLMVQTIEDRLPGFGRALQARLDGAAQPPIRGVIFANDNMVAANDNELWALQEENAALRSRLDRIERRLVALGG